MVVAIRVTNFDIAKLCASGHSVAVKTLACELCFNHCENFIGLVTKAIMQTNHTQPRKKLKHIYIEIALKRFSAFVMVYIKSIICTAEPKLSVFTFVAITETAAE